MAGGQAKLAVMVDGQPLGDDDARAFWGRFSAYMEAHRSDLAGFAKQEGFASVHPETGPNGAVLVASRTARQRPYATAPDRPNPGAARSTGSAKIHASSKKPGK
jgi:hypothetical protein